MLINLSNHPSSAWSVEQMQCAKQTFKEVVDLPFPQVDPYGDEVYIDAITDEYVEKTFVIAANRPFAVHIMGEQTFAFSYISKMQKKNILCVASTTERIVEDLGNGTKKSEFRFVKFRKY